MFLAWFWDSKLSKFTFIGKNKARRVNGGTNFDSPGQRWVPKLIFNIIAIFNGLINNYLFTISEDLPGRTANFTGNLLFHVFLRLFEFLNLAIL